MFRYALDPLSTEEPSADRQTISLIGLAQSQFSCNNWCRYSRTIAQLAHNNIPATQSNSELWTRRRAGDNYCTLLGVGDLVSQPYNWSIICWFRYRSLRFVALVLTTSDYEHINFYLHAKCSKQCLLSLYTTNCFYPDVTGPLPDASVSRGFVASNRSSTLVNTRWQTEDLPLNFIHYLLLLQLLLLGLLPDWHWTVSTVHNHGDKTGGVLNDRYHHRFTTCLMHWLWNGQTNDSLVEIKNYFYLLAAVP